MNNKIDKKSSGQTGSVLIIGGGIAGMQAALDLANSGYYVYLTEKSPSIGGVMAQLDKTFPTNDCAMCIMSPKLVEVGRHLNIKLLTLSEVTGVKGEKGNFEVDITQHPRYVDMDKCIACGACAEKCPKKVDDLYNERLVKRKAIYVPYPQAVPLKYAIDKDNCIFLKKGKKCRVCEKVCPAGAINFDDRGEKLTLNVGAIILSPGFSTFDPKGLDTYIYADHPDVVTSIEFERVLSASGPTTGHLVRLSDHKEPEKIAWFQCVGSRDINNCDHLYCSSVCCMYAIKQAIIAKEHSAKDIDCTIFYMDMRTHGKGFEQCYTEAREKYGIKFIRCRVHSVVPQVGGGLGITYINDEGKMISEIHDIVVLSVGMEISDELKKMAGILGVDLNENGFCNTATFNPVGTSRDGIYVCGAFQGPKDIPQSVIEAGSAANMAGMSLSSARNTLTKTMVSPEEIDISGDRPRIGVFICQCGINIGGVIDVPGVRDYAATLPFVEYVADNLYTCSQDTQDVMTQVIKEHNLNRIVVAACTPKTHEPLFQETLINAGLNKYLFEMVNIRNQDSWVHKDSPELATKKAMDLVRMAVAKTALLEPLEEAELNINPKALVIGGGISGMAAAKAIADQGFEVNIIERGPALGGQALNLFKTWKGEDIGKGVINLANSLESNDKIKIYLNTELRDVKGFVGNFKSFIKGTEEIIEHGITVMATGAFEHQPDEYFYKKDPRVMTSLELDKKFIDNEPDIKKVKTAVFIQCVGSREAQRPYCSRVCCTHSIKSALHLKELNPDMNIFILYRDIRTYGEREMLYKQARESGVIFIRFSEDQKPVVGQGKECLEIEVMDYILCQPVKIKADILTLASAIEPYNDEKLARFFKVPMDKNGFFVEAHVKLGPSEFATDGVFMCGLAHYPKSIDESIAQAQAAVSRAITLLSQKNIHISGNISYINQRLCSGCGLCVEVCPYNAPYIIEEGPNLGKSEINPVLCKGCGVCVASCRAGAINLKGFETAQIFAMLDEM